MLGAQNPQITESINNLFSQIMEEQSKLDKVVPPSPDKTKLLESKLKDFSEIRGKGFFYNYFSTGRGHGPFTELIDGSVKFDLIGGIGVNLLGHSHPIYVKSVLEAATLDSIMCGNLQAYDPAYQLTKNIIDAVKEKSRLKYFWFSCSGSFANDVALKILWQKMAPKYNLIAFTRAFAGRSVATQDITYNEEYRVGMPKTIDVHHALHYDQKDPANAIEKTIRSLNEIWDKEPNTFCAMTIETIQGEGGFIYGPREWYVAVFEWARSKNIYIWIDEVQTFGRTYELFSYQTFELDEYVDIVTVGKCLQACGTLYTEELNPQPGLIAGTFNGSLPALHAGAQTINYLRKGNFYGKDGRIHDLEKKFKKGFEKIKAGKNGAQLGYFGGVGTMLSFEVGDGSKDKTTAFVKKLFDNGIISFIAGKDPTRVRFLLPISLTDEHIEKIFEIIDKSIEEFF